jgi:hypothetical protein
MKVINKESFGIFFKEYFLHLEDDDGSLSEICVEKNVWENYNIGDTYDISENSLYNFSKKSWWMK